MSTLELSFHTVIDTSWRASWLILFVIGLRCGFRGHVAPRLLFGIWLVVALRLLMPISIPAAWSPFNFAPWSEVPVRAAITAESSTPARFAMEPAVMDSGSRGSVGGTVSSALTLSPSQWAAVLWAGGVAALLVARALVWIRFSRKLRRTMVPPSPQEKALLVCAARSLAMRDVPVLITDAVKAPALHGIGHPRILFPPGFVEQLSASELRLTLAHELAHARRRDLLADAMLHLAVVMHWFNPLAWVVARLARQDCELACDETVLRQVRGGDREGYGATLLRIARLTTGARRTDFTLGVVASRAQIKRRIQMIVANRSFTRSGMLLGGGVVAVLSGLSFTSEVEAQTPIRSVVPAAHPAPAVAVQSNSAGILYNPSIDRLDALFPTGVVATVADRSITVADVRTYIGPLIPQLQRSSRTQEEFNGKLTLLQNSAVKELVARRLLIRQFHDQRDGEQPKQISADQIDNSIADMIAGQFGGDRSRYLEYLKSRGLTQRDYRKEVEEDIIHNYMRGQERKAAGTVSRTKVDPAVERPVRLRLIQLTRAEGETDASLLEKANMILARFRNGESFERLAREFDQSKKRDAGGDWGWMGAADMRTEYRDAFIALKKGDASAPIVVKEGCFLLYADDRR
jgi:peptidyl-prolyl cis-trans isomerase SurA